jgi:hypothetical protein
MRALVFGLNLASALAALGAAVFWFRSAARDLPPMLTYWDRAPPHDPLFQALQASVRDNRWAATLAGVAALLMAVATVVDAARRT